MGRIIYEHNMGEEKPRLLCGECGKYMRAICKKTVAGIYELDCCEYCKMTDRKKKIADKIKSFYKKV